MGKTGVSELLSNVLDRGAAGMNAQQIAKAVEELGASRYVASDEETFTLGMHGLAPDAVIGLLALHSGTLARAEFSRSS